MDQNIKSEPGQTGETFVKTVDDGKVKAKSLNIQKSSVDDDLLLKCDRRDHTSTASNAPMHGIGPVARAKCRQQGIALKEFRCILCEDFATISRADLKEHLMSVHGKTSNPKTKCPKCDYATADQYVLRGHIRAVHDKVKHLRCGECDFTTSFISSLRRHERDVHKPAVSGVKTRRTQHVILTGEKEERDSKETGDDVGALEDPLGQLDDIEYSIEDVDYSIKSEGTLEEREENVVE